MKKVWPIYRTYILETLVETNKYVWPNQTKVIGFLFYFINKRFSYHILISTSKYHIRNQKQIPTTVELVM